MTYRFDAAAVLIEIQGNEDDGAAKPAKPAKSGHSIRTLPDDLGAASLKEVARSTPSGNTKRNGNTLPDMPGCEELSELLGADWDWIRQNPKILEACREAETVRRMREAGIVPSHYTESTVCGHCGRVPIVPGCPDKVLACPWCFNRLKGLPIPRAPHCEEHDNE